MRRLLFVLLTLASLASFADEPRPLRVGVSIDFEPMAFIVSDEVQGIEVDFARMLAARIDRPLEIKIYAFKDLIDALESGEIDIIMSGMSITDERKERVRFSEPYMDIGQMAIVRTEDASKFGQPNALNTDGLKVGVHQGTTGEAYVLDNLPHANMIAYEGVEQGLAALRNGDVDVFIHDSTTSWQLSRSFVNDNLMSLNRFLTKESIAWAVRKDDPELLTTVNLILKDMKAQGQVSDVINRWLPVIPVTL
ncbi:MAG: transporter substrate-binding domain-containing protein [Pseudomonadales bacterium]|nr:transporter substrate-binding domain-containing protein [Pseudomonadales bacterium]